MSFNQEVKKYREARDFLNSVIKTANIICNQIFPAFTYKISLEDRTAICVPLTKDASIFTIIIPIEVLLGSREEITFFVNEQIEKIAHRSAIKEKFLQKMEETIIEELSIQEKKQSLINASGITYTEYLELKRKIQDARNYRHNWSKRVWRISKKL